MSSKLAGPSGVPGHYVDQAAVLKDLQRHHERRLAGHLPSAVDNRLLRRYLELRPLPGGLTAMLLHQALPGVRVGAANKWVDPLNAACRKYLITYTARRLAAFLGHIAHESGNLHTLEENMRYKDPKRLVNTYPKAFKTAQDAEPFLNSPEALGNKVYANRIGNGDSASGDGWKYRGRGLIQLTGKDNYAALAQDIKVDLVANPELVATPKYAALSAAWFWKKHGLNELADSEGYTALSKRINRSLQSFPKREAKRKHALDALCRAILLNIFSSVSHHGTLI